MTTSSAHPSVHPWPVHSTERLEPFIPMPPPRGLFHDNSIVLDDCAIAGSMMFNLRVPVRRLGLFNGYSALTCPKVADGDVGGHATSATGKLTCVFIDVFALERTPEALDPYLHSLERILPRVQAPKNYRASSLLGWQIELAMADPGAAEGYRGISVNASSPELVRETWECLRMPADTGRGALISTLRQTSDGSEGQALLGLRCWADGDALIIDKWDLHGPRYELLTPEELDTEPFPLTYRVSLQRRPVADAIERMYYVYQDIQARIDQVVRRCASRGFL